MKGLQDYFGTALLLARSLELVKRNIQEEGVKILVKTGWRDNSTTLGELQRLLP